MWAPHFSPDGATLTTLLEIEKKTIGLRQNKNSDIIGLFFLYEVNHISLADMFGSLPTTIKINGMPVTGR
jgi:hypothetical protein